MSEARAVSPESAAPSRLRAAGRAGGALGTVLAFMMAVIALSLPELVILRKVLTIRLAAVFIGVVGAGILLVGCSFNWLL